MNRTQKSMKQEELAWLLPKIVKNNVLYVLQGEINSWMDGYITREQLEKAVSTDRIKDLIEEEFDFKQEYIISKNTRRAIEMKHIKFLGGG